MTGQVACTSMKLQVSVAFEKVRQTVETQLLQQQARHQVVRLNRAPQVEVWVTRNRTWISIEKLEYV